MVFSAGFRKHPGGIGPRQIIDHVMVESAFSGSAASTSLKQVADQWAWGEQGRSRRICTAYAELKGESNHTLLAKNSLSAVRIGSDTAGRLVWRNGQD